MKKLILVFVVALVVVLAWAFVLRRDSSTVPASFAPDMFPVGEESFPEHEFVLWDASPESGVIKWGITKDGVGYVWIASFEKGAAHRVAEIVGEMNQSSSATALVIDMRGNPGGRSFEGFELIDMFVDADGLPSSLREYPGELKEPEGLTTRGDISGGARLLLLVNRNSASTSEMVTGALQDHGRATVLGTQTSGHGTVERRMSIGSLDFDQVIAEFYTPKGRKIHGVGLSPDVNVREGVSPDFASRGSNKDKMFQRALRLIRKEREEK